MQITPFEPSQTSEITALYAHYVGTTAITFDLDPPSESQMAEKLHGLLRDGYPVLVATNDSNEFAGFAYASSYRPKRAYQHSAEVTIYVDPAAQGQGVGNALMSALIQALETAPHFHLAIAMIADDAKASIRLHQKFGFEKVGYLPEVGRKFDQWHGVSIMQRSLALAS